ncbi:MAG: YdcH family protein [Pseudomonadota bacterium]
MASLQGQYPELDQLWREHQELEATLEAMNERIYLTPEEQVERKRLQKLKLAGRDRIEAILAGHRSLG